VNFADSTRTANIINNYVSKATNGLIDGIVEPRSLSTDTRYFYPEKIS
jgi:serine protease inhibitor